MQTVTPRPDLPHCFARDWDKDSPECAGGRDSTYTHPRTGLSIRDQCTYFASCGSRTQAQRMAQTIPASHLVRPPVLTPPPTAPTAPASMGEYLRQQQQQAAYRPGPAPMPQAVPMPQYGPYHPGATYHLNYEMPPYLSVPEERLPGETLKSVLLREVIRSIFKAMGHAIAHFFDARKMKEKT